MIVDRYGRPLRQNKKSLYAEIAHTAEGRDVTKGFLLPDMPMEPEDKILNEQGGGDYDIYAELLRDDQVFSCFQQRRLAVISREWDVDAGGNKRADKSAAALVKEQLTDIFDNATNKMLFGVFYGFAVSEVLYRKDGSHVALDDIKTRKRHRFFFDGLSRLRLRTQDNPMGELMPPRKFWVFNSGADNDDDPYGIGLGYNLYFPVKFKKHGIQFHLIFLDKFASPTGLGRFPLNADDEAQDRLLQAVSAIQRESAIIIPQGMEIELLEATRNGTADYGSFEDKMDSMIAKVILGQTATTEGTAGKLGNEETRNDVKKEYVKSDADLVCSTFNKQVAKWLTELNYPNAMPPKVWRKMDDEEDVNDRAERESKIYQMGFKPTLKHILETYGGEWEAANTPEPELEPEAVEPIDEAAVESDFNESEDDPVKPHLERLEQEAGEAWKTMFEPLKRMIKSAKSLEDVRDNLSDLYPEMDATALQSLLGKVCTAMELKGRMDITDGN